MNNKYYKSIWLTQKNKCIVKSLKVPSEFKNECLVIDSCFSLISQGSEKIVFDGNVPLNITKNMIIPYQINEFNYPFNYGYSLVGKVVRGPNDMLGKHVHLLHPHTSMAFVQRKDCTLIPDHISLEDATLLSQIQTAITAIWDAKIRFGDRILIMGFGLIGTLIASILKDRIDLQILVYEPNQERSQIASSMGLDTCMPHDKENLIDIVFYCTSNFVGLQDAFQVLRNNAKLIQVAWFGDKRVSLELGGLFHVKRLQWISSQVSQIPDELQSKWSMKSRNELAFKCLGMMNVSQLSKQTTHINALADTYPSLLTHPNLIQLIKY